MKKRNLQRIFAAFIATAMAVSTAACTKEKAEEPKKDDAPATTEAAKKDEPAAKVDEPVVEEPVDDGPVVLTHSDGSPIDLGGMEIIIRDWWSTYNPDAEPANDYEEAQFEWWDYIQETYNFKIHQDTVSDWGSAPQDFIDYVTMNGDENNYVFVLRNDPSLAAGFSNGLFYDLATLDCLDFDSDLFVNGTHNLYTFGKSIYGMAAGLSEPRTGVYFNKDVLRDAGIDPDSIYDLQAKGQWTWDKFDELMGIVQRDVDNDGVDDFYGLTLNEGVMDEQAIFSNNGSWFYKDENGKFVYNLESPETLQAMNWTKQMFEKYDNHDPEGAQWDYYKEEFLSGKVGFMVEQEYAGSEGGSGNFMLESTFDYGFVMFPKGPAASDYVNIWDNNIIAIPACYDAERAWNCAFAWALYNTAPAGYEGKNGFIDKARGGTFDEKAITETIPMMSADGHGVFNCAGQIPGIDLTKITYNISATGEDISALVEKVRDEYKGYVDAANGN